MIKQTKCHHALISIGFTISFIFIMVVICGAEPQIPLIFSCLAAGMVALNIGYTWDEILKNMIAGITQSLEAILILMLIGILVGTWILSGTVPAMIYYGIQLISAKYFLFTASFLCLLVSFAIGAWGTVGTIGLAFMGIGQALGIPAPMVAGCIVSGAYCGEIISPLSDATNLTAAVAGTDVFKIMKKILPAALIVFMLSEVVYLLLGLTLPGSEEAAIGNDINQLTISLNSSFHISPLALIPMGVMIFCILIKFPAIPSMLAGIFSGYITAFFLQNASVSSMLASGYSGFNSSSGIVLLDSLLTAGGIMSMMNAISIILIAMAFGGLMQYTGQMQALIAPVLKYFRRKEALYTLTASTCILANIILPDQYLGISVPGQMYAEEYDKRKLTRLNLSRSLLCAGAVTSPLIPWNTCGIYCFSMLAVRPFFIYPMPFSISSFQPLLLLEER